MKIKINHLSVSLLKSFVRMAGAGTSLMLLLTKYNNPLNIVPYSNITNSIIILSATILIAEALGVIEELIEKEN